MREIRNRAYASFTVTLLDFSFDHLALDDQKSRETRIGKAKLIHSINMKVFDIPVSGLYEEDHTAFKLVAGLLIQFHSILAFNGLRQSLLRTNTAIGNPDLNGGPEVARFELRLAAIPIQV